jgi:hypothetical protein
MNDARDMLIEDKAQLSSAWPVRSCEKTVEQATRW